LTRPQASQTNRDSPLTTQPWPCIYGPTRAWFQYSREGLPAVTSNRLFTKLATVILTLSLAGLCSASHITLHYHILADGRVVVHSHPLSNGSSRQNHEHSRQQYTQLDAAAQILDTIILGSFDNLTIISCPCGIAHIEIGSLPLSIPVFPFAQRAPPSVPHS